MTNSLAPLCNKAVEWSGLGAEPPGALLALPLTGYATLGNSLNLQCLSFCIWEVGIIIIAFSQGGFEKKMRQDISST